jgi:hypothetical protein
MAAAARDKSADSCPPEKEGYLRIQYVDPISE